MHVGIQRRTIYLEPLRSMEVLWVSSLLDDEEIAEMFALHHQVPGWHFRNHVKDGRAVVGTIRRVVDGVRIGFAVMFAPDPVRTYWEIAAAIPQKRHRDGFSMLHTVDAMSHYMFDVRGVELCGARVRLDNTASEAVVKRLGYQRVRQEMSGGELHWVYNINRADWARRRTKLEAGELTHPSGAGAAFVILQGPPFEPIRP